MPWLAPPTVVTGDIVTAAWGNSYVRDNPSYLKSVSDGTNTDKIPNAALASGIDASKITTGTLNGALLATNGSVPLTALATEAQRAASQPRAKLLSTAGGGDTLAHATSKRVGNLVSLFISGMTALTVGASQNTLRADTAGKYLVGATLAFSGAVPNFASLTIYVDSVAIVQDVAPSGVAAARPWALQQSTAVNCGAASTIWMEGYQESGGAISVQTAELWAVRIGA